jgi:CheY-like chemotaxis protein/HPt (histidine-containing phosphotransfer) domain-containing protein
MATTLLPAPPSGHKNHRTKIAGWHADVLPDTLLGTMSSPPIPIRVLIVDDDATIRELLGALLAGEGYLVEAAESGEAALALLRRPESVPDLVLADVQMPGTTGAQLARQLRRACGPSTLLLAISGSQPPAQAISRFDGFLMKPFKMEEVAAALHARIHRSRNPGDAPATEIAAKRRKPTAASRLGRDSLPPSMLASISASPQKALSKIPGNVPTQEAQLVESADSVPVLNENIYRQLAGSVPTPQLQEMYALCVNDARRRIAGMRTLAVTRDSAQFVREAHSIKGGCGMLGATELHRMAAELETNGLAPGRAGAALNVNSLDELSAACDRLERMLGTRV